jgi:very-short-patch-repair endonuclease
MGHMRPESGKASADEVIARLASRAHGVVTRQELLRAGVTRDQIKRRLRRGTLIAVHRGVYRVGHSAASREAQYMAAVKACGEQAVLCGRAAAHMWRILGGSPPPPEVMAPVKRHVPGVLTRRRVISRRHVVARQRIPVTTVPRTLVDLAASLSEEALARACHDAGGLYKTTPKQVDAVLRRVPNARGRKKLERIMHGDVPVTLSRLESRFLELLRDAHLPLPVTNQVAGAHRVDCRWPEQRLTVELDSYRHHNSRHSWDKDRLREREARIRGDEFRRYTWRDVFEDPVFMLRELSELLGIAELEAI